MIVEKSGLCFLLLFGWAKSVPLLGGRYVTTSDVHGILDFSKDIAEMEDNPDPEQRERIYRSGSNAYTVDPDTGERETISLASLSVDATSAMGKNALFVLVRHFFDAQGRASGESEGFFMGNPVDAYADAIVTDLFSRNNPSYETEAVLILNVWMAVAHELYEVLNGCYNEHDTMHSLAALDKAMSLWVGEGQTTGSTVDGNMLYRLAEVAGARFGQTDEFGESWANRRIVEVANSLQISLTFAANCLPTAESNMMRDKVYEMLSMMSIPLIQNAMHHVISQNSDSVVDWARLYSYTILPRVAACDRNAATQLDVDSFSGMSATQRTDWSSSLQDALSCFKLSCGDIGLQDNFPQCNDGPMPVELAGYTAATADARQLSFLDRDFYQIQILMLGNAPEAAYDIYDGGYNSRFSLRQLALNQAIPTPSLSTFNLFRTYYESSDDEFLDNEIQMALQGRDRYANASTDQQREMTLGLILYQAVYLSIESALQNSIDECRSGDVEAAIGFWDMGAAFFIGSYEGSAPGGINGGQLIHGCSKRLCRMFGTCEDGNDRNNSQANKIVVDALNAGSAFIASGNCSGSENMFNNFISPFLKVPLIQGAIAAALDAENLPQNSGDGAIGRMHVFSRAILPFLNEANTNSANVVDRNLRYSDEDGAVPDGIEVVADAFRGALPLAGTNCEDLGTSTASAISFCGGLGQSSYQDTNLAFGRYNFSHPETVSLYSRIAWDFRDMVQANALDEAQRIYTNGANARIAQEDDESTAALSLASFSIDGATAMSQDPMFNIFKYALYDDQTLESAEVAAFTYAHEIVLEVFGSTSDQALAAEAALVLNVWMMIAHKLHLTERSCRRQANPIEHIDAAVALWIGKDQREGTFRGGWLMYNWAQEALLHFGFDEAEAPINAQLMSQFTELQSIARGCPDDILVPDTVRVKIEGILRSLAVPLVQHLLIGMAANDERRAAVYSSAVVSQSAACSSEVYISLSEVLYSDFSKDLVDETVTTNLALFLRCLRITCEDLATSQHVNPELEDLVGNICQVLKSKSNATNILQYEPENSAYEQSRVDLDARQIGIFMQTKAYDTALDYFVHGHNSFKMKALDGSNEIEKSLTSLHQLIQLPDGLEVSNFDTFSQYFGSETYAEDLLMECFQRSGPFAGATRRQVLDAAGRTLQAVVSYRAVVVKMFAAIQTCRDGGTRGASRDWDNGVAILVGSVDAFLSQENSNSGTTLHSLLLEQCTLFGSCASTDESQATSDFLAIFQDGSSLLRENKCDEVEVLVESRLLPLMQVPLIQGTLAEAFGSADQGGSSVERSKDNSGAAGYVFAQSILPVVNDSNEESAAAIARVFNSPLNPATGPVAGETVFEAFQQALPGMGINCDDMGELSARSDLSFCAQYEVPVGFENIAGFGLDIAAMKHALSRGQQEQARLIYTQGTNVQRSSAEAGVAVEYTSLQSLSTLATKEMIEEPVFNLFLFHFGDGEGVTSGASYADVFVQEALNAGEDSTLAAEAALVLNVWMYFIHSTYTSLSSCRESLDASKAVDAIDEAVAFWLGDVGLSESSPNGSLLFSLASQMQAHFESDFFPFDINEEILGRLGETKMYLEGANECTGDSGSFSRRFELANQISTLATIPLMQGLIHNLRIGDMAHSRLYATAIVPLLTVCSPNNYNFLKTSLLDGEINLFNIDEIVDALYDTLPCLGLKCTQVGIHSTETVSGFPSHPRCEVVANQTSSIAGYRPEYQFSKYAPIDLDMGEVDVLLQMNAFTAASDILVYGRHASVSVVDLATSPGRETIPFFGLYSEYFDSVDYGKDLIINALENGDATKLTTLQQRVFVVRFTQALVLEHAALEMMYKSLQACENNDGQAAMHSPWDAAAGLLIGSINRTTSKSMWYAPFDLAQEHCEEFDTCIVSTSGSSTMAQTNKIMIELLYAGRGAASSAKSDCRGIRKIAGEMASLLLVPIIQGVLSTSVRMSLASESDPDDVAKAFVFSRVLLPRIQDIDPSAAESLEEILTLKSKSISKSTAESMFALFHGLYDDLGVDCEAIGVHTEGFDACNVPDAKKTLQKGGKSGSKAGLIIGIIVAVLVLLFALVYWYWRKWRFAKYGTNLSRGSNIMSPRKSFANSRPLSYRDTESKALSPKASNLLDLILSYGDDETVDGGRESSMSFRDEHTGFLSSVKPAETFDGGDLGVMKEEDEFNDEDSSTDPSNTGSPTRSPSEDHSGDVNGVI